VAISAVTQAEISTSFSKAKTNMYKKVYTNSGTTFYTNCDWSKKKVDLASCGLQNPFPKRHMKRASRTAIAESLKNIEGNLRDSFPGEDVDYALVGDDIELVVNYTVVNFPAGFIRQKKKIFSSVYISKLIEAILTK
jgi:hypothetical protein